MTTRRGGRAPRSSPLVPTGAIPHWDASGKDATTEKVMLLSRAVTEFHSVSHSRVRPHLASTQRWCVLMCDDSRCLCVYPFLVVQRLSDLVPCPFHGSVASSFRPVQCHRTHVRPRHSRLVVVAHLELHTRARIAGHMGPCGLSQPSQQRNTMEHHQRPITVSTSVQCFLSMRGTPL